MAGCLSDTAVSERIYTDAHIPVSVHRPTVIHPCPIGPLTLQYIEVYMVGTYGERGTSGKVYFRVCGSVNKRSKAKKKHESERSSVIIHENLYLCDSTIRSLRAGSC